MKRKYASPKMCLSALLAMAILGAAGSSQANTLYFDFNQNYSNPDASVFLFGDAGQQASVSSLSGFSQNVSLGSDGFANVFLPDTLQQSGTGILDKGLKIQSVDPIAGYFINRAPQTSDMTYILEEDALGKDYVIASDGGSFGEGSQVMIHAIADNTTVTFTPKGGPAINVTLNAGETYKYAGGTTDLTGSTVVSSKNVSVSAGHACTNVPNNVLACDTLIEQMIPTKNLSTDYLLTASQGADNSFLGVDLVRIIATEDNTQVTVDGAVVATLDRGDAYEYQLAAGTGSHVEASAPVMVAQYLTGGQGGNLTDPSLSLVPGADSWLDEYRLSTPTGSQQFDRNYASLVVPTTALSSLMLDGMLLNSSLFSSIGSTGFSRGSVNLPLGLFNLTASSDFLVMLGGGASYDSYLTYGGATFSPGISPPEPPDDNEPPTTVAEPNVMALFGIGLLLVGFGAVIRRRSDCR